MTRARRLRSAVLGCHVGLAAAVAGTALTLPASPAARAVLLAAGLAVLAWTGHGIAARRRNSLTYCALVLVLVIGAATAEVVASAERASFATLALVVALVELGLLVLHTREAA